MLSYKVIVEVIPKNLAVDVRGTDYVPPYHETVFETFERDHAYELKDRLIQCYVRGFSRYVHDRLEYDFEPLYAFDNNHVVLFSVDTVENTVLGISDA